MDALSYLTFLKQHGYVDDAQIQLVLEEQKLHGKHVVDLVEDMGILPSKDQYALLATDLGAQVVDLNACHFTPDLLEKLPPQIARVHGALPVYFSEGVLYVALTNPPRLAGHREPPLRQRARRAGDDRPRGGGRGAHQALL